MKTYTTVHAVAQNSEGKFLILQRAPHRTNPGKWNFITGYIQERESAEDAALRELKEETNLEGEIIKTTEPWWRDHEGKRFIIVTSLIKVSNEKDLQVDPGESQAHEWISTSDNIVKEISIMIEDFKRLGII
jgi:8-oxo-dGTP diphosphatase